MAKLSDSVKKRKAEVLGDTEQAMSTGVEVATPDTKPKKKKKTKVLDSINAISVDVEVQNVIPEETISTQNEPSEVKPRKKRKADKDTSVTIADTEDKIEPEPKSKKRRRKENTAQGEQPVPEQNESAQTDAATLVTDENTEPLDAKPKAKKKRRTAAATQDEEPMAIPAPAGEKKSKNKPKKSKPHKDGRPDPMTDDTLSDQAKPAIAYASSYVLHTAVGTLAEWKFNKVKQKWLVRHGLDEQTVPEAYAETVLAYLATVQGGVRDQLFRTCRAVLEGTSAVPPSEEQAGVEVPEAARLSKERAERLLRMLERT